MVAHLPDKEQMCRFVCRGLVDVPGVSNVNYCIYQDGVVQKQSSNGDPKSFKKFTIKLKAHRHGELLIHLSDVDAFSPYIPFIENLSNMLAVIFEERRQRYLNKLIMLDLEKRVYERTKELEKEIVERKQAEVTLRESEENLRITLNSIGDAVISTDIDGNITRMNQVAETLTGWKREEGLGKPLTAVFHIINDQTRKPIENPVEKVMKAGKVVGLASHTVLIAKDGTEYQIADSGAPIQDKKGNVMGVVLVFRDVTVQLKTEKELLKVKKLESVGLLAGGIAHDFNNLLTGLYGSIELAKVFLSNDHKSYHHLESAERSMESATNLTKQLLTFARGGDPIKENLSIGEVITESAKFSIRGSRAKLRTNLSPDLWLVKADKGQLCQVISNLVINADQAMPTGGMIVISAKNRESSESKYVQINVQDEGVGIAPQYLEKIFDPFFRPNKREVD